MLLGQEVSLVSEDGAFESGYVVRHTDLGLIAEHLSNFLLAFPGEMLVNSVLHRVYPLLEARIPVVLHCVVGAAHELLRDERPLLVVLVAQDEQHPLLGLGPLSALNFRVQVVEPALTARFAAAAVQSVGEVAPHHVLVELALVVDVAQDDLIFLRGPVADGVGGGFLKVSFHKLGRQLFELN